MAVPNDTIATTAPSAPCSTEPDLPDLSAWLAQTFVVVPAYNEARVIRQVVDTLCTRFPQVVVVDDGSRDGTSAALAGSNAILLRHAVNLGQGAALQTGISYALAQGANFIVTFDADGQHALGDALKMVAELARGACDAVVGSRFSGQAINLPATRRLMLKLAVIFTNVTTHTELSDAHNGLRALNRRAAAALDLTQNGMAHASELLKQLAEAKLRIRELPVTITYTDYSLHKGQSTGNALNILIDLAVRRFLR